MSHASRRLQQIESDLEELCEFTRAPNITRGQRNDIASKIRKLMDERDALESDNHYLSGTRETKPNMKAVQDIVQRDIHNGFSNNKESKS